MGKAAALKPLTVKGPVVLEVEREEPGPASIREGAERVGAFTVRYTGKSFWQVFHHCFYGKPEFPIPG